MNQVKLPNFLIIGVEKSGTTSIYNYLNQHPEVYMSPVKETNFLEREWSLEESRKPSRIDTLDKYTDLFKNVTNEKAIGEVSPNYLFKYKTSIPKIYKLLPNAKLIAILRHPVERAYSDYLMHIRDVIGGKNVPSLSAQATKDPITSFTIRKGLYAEPLAAFFEAFGRDNIKVYLYDDLQESATAFMQDIYEFIGVDPTFIPDTSKRAQKAAVPKNQTVNTVLRTQNLVRKTVASILRLFLSEATRQKIRDRLLAANYQSKAALPLAEEERQLLQDLYREDILKLQELLETDLSHWLKPTMKA
ncbi:sulfotransferase [Limnospira maxima CS-328]|uniref:Sulfotransferase n=1 Tax=Limnospira maxima CS-328 TaxID=513049 RepID=B5VZ48_LIMMA|nr:sulfotransferase [Limnospira maxima]EDZ95516.1 sulfotransferase [Limnospira maxima CS-328]MDC0840615.1 sulfotransferase [Limnoraphis robusta]